MGTDWDRLSALIEGCLKLNPRQRHRFVEIACGRDLELRREVDALLEGVEEEETSAFLERPLIDVHCVREDDPVDLGPYRLVRPLAEGLTTVVYLALPEAKAACPLERPPEVGDLFRWRDPDCVVVKFIRRGMRRLGVYRDLLRNEFVNNLVCSLVSATEQHPNIVRVLSLEPRPFPYIVSEYIDGDPIDLFCRKRELSFLQRVELFLEVCSAVEHTHSRGFLHLDLKPANVLVEATGKPKLIDFGSSRSIRHQRQFPLQATGEFASPEYLRGEPVQASSDVFSLGVLCYYLICGIHPYLSSERSLTVDTAGANFLYRQPLELSRLCGHSGQPHAAVLNRDGQAALASSLDRALLRSIEADPSKRFGSVGEFIHELNRGINR